MPELGGRRSTSPEQGGSVNAGWRVPAFRAYADHLRSPEFAEGRARLHALALERPTAVMCAEAAWWRCHRRLIADVLVLDGQNVEHVMPDGGLTAHEPPERGGITASFLAKKPGPTTELEPAAMRFSYQELGTGVLEAYERLFHDAMIGDKTLFASAPGIERLWEFAAALLDAPPPVRRYPQSGWGPEPAVDDLIAPRRWALP